MSTAPTPNVELLRATLAHIETHPEEWDQDTWRCGTTACYAGHAVIIDGGVWENAHDEYLLARDGDPADHVWTDRPGSQPIISVELRARHVLGLTRAQADDLFGHDNSLDDLREIVAELTGGAS